MNKKTRQDLLDSLLFYLKFFGIVAAIGTIIVLPIMLPGDKQGTTDTVKTAEDNTKKELTLEQGEAYVGKTIREFCDKYSGYDNVSLYAAGGGRNISGGAYKCADAGALPFPDDFVIVQAYTNEQDEGVPEEYRKVHIYIDSLPRAEAIDLGIIEEGN